MTQTRREFIRTFGAALAAALGAGLLPGCTPTSAVATAVTATPAVPVYPTCYVPTMVPTATALIVPMLRHPAWATLRTAWLALRKPESAGHYASLIEMHRIALNELMTAGELNTAVAEQIQTAYAEVSAYYAEHSGTPTPEMTCYIVVAPTDASGSTAVPASTCYSAPELQRGRAALAQETVALEAMAALSALDPVTVDKARRALEQDISLFEVVATFETLAADEHRQHEDRLVAQYVEGHIDVPPETAEAALILVALLTKGEAP